MKKQTLLKSAVAILGLAVATAASAASPWSARVRATYLQTADKSDAFTALGIGFGKDAVHVNDKLIPELNVAYAFSDVWSAELVLTIPQTQDVSLAGVGNLGSFKHLPPTLLLQYRANPDGAVRPYVGAGINHTFIFDDSLSVAGVPLGLDNSSTGLALQAGLDFAINERWSFNVDLKYVRIASGVYAGGAKLTEAKLNPNLYALGLRYAF